MLKRPIADITNQKKVKIIIYIENKMGNNKKNKL